MNGTERVLEQGQALVGAIEALETTAHPARSSVPNCGCCCKPIDGDWVQSSRSPQPGRARRS